MHIDILLVDDFPLVREGLATALGADPGLHIVGEAGSGKEGLQLALQLRPDIVVLELKLPDMGGMTVLHRLRAEAPEIKALVFTASEQAQTLLDAVGAGAAGYLTKRASAEELRQAVITIHGGASVISPSLAGHVLRDCSRTARGQVSGLRPRLRDREHEVLRLVVEGHTDREIAERLYISPRTVQNHLTNIREKTGLRRRPELARWAMAHAMT